MTDHMSDRAERALAGALVLYQSESLADTILEASALDRAAGHVQPGCGVKADDGKARWDLMPAAPLAEVVDVLTFGADKYTDYGWREYTVDQLFAAVQRHLWAWRQGAGSDPESGRSHLAHATASLLMIRDLEAMRCD